MRLGQEAGGVPFASIVSPLTRAVLVSQTNIRRDARIGNPLETQRCLSDGGTRDSSTRPIALATQGVSACCMPWRLTVSLGMAHLDEVREGLQLFARQAWASAYAALAGADERAPWAADQLGVLATAAYRAGLDAATSQARAPA